MKILKNALVILICLGALGALTDLYLYPGMEAVYAGRTDTVMSDGTDPTGITYLYDAALQVWKEHPSRFLYGAVYSEVAGDPEHGSAIWMPWNERWLVLGLSKFVPLEQISTSLVFLLFIFDAVAMYFLSRQLRWSKSISVGLAFAWAFNCFNRARAKVHGAMVGAYHLPLIFLAILLLVRGKKETINCRGSDSPSTGFDSCALLFADNTLLKSVFYILAAPTTGIQTRPQTSAREIRPSGLSDSHFPRVYKNLSHSGKFENDLKCGCS